MNITVDNDFARFGSKSYAINKITSVDVRERVKLGSRAFVVWGLSAIGAVALAILVHPAWLILAATAVLLAWGSWKRRHDVSTYFLFLNTSGSETQAMSTDSSEEVDRLRSEIERAISASGRARAG